MFDRRITVHSRVAPAYPQEVHEHRAPTADSARLLSELEKEAESRVIARFRTEGNNTIEGTWTVSHDMATIDIKFVCRYRVNGTEAKWEHLIKEGDWRQDRKRALQDMFKAFVEHLAITALAEDLFKQIQQAGLAL